MLIEIARERIASIRKALGEAREAMDMDMLISELGELKLEQNSEGFWNDMNKVQKINKQAKLLSVKINMYDGLYNTLEDSEIMLDLIVEQEAHSELIGLEKEIVLLEKKVEEFRIAALLKGQYDGLNAILTLNAGAGGTEAQDWVSMLFRMYTKYVDKAGYTMKVLDMLDGDEAGIKSISFQVSGDYAYGYLKAEKGVHRLVRISPFDSNKRRHTSFAALDVMPEIIDNSAIEINSEDLRVDTYRSSGKGGQHVNKTDSAVRLTHLPTGLVTQCQSERSQGQNKDTAMRMLISKLSDLKEQERLATAKEIQGDIKHIEWGSQIRSYVFCPYTLVKDHRTGFETGNIQAVMDGDIDGFIIDYLKKA